MGRTRTGGRDKPIEATFMETKEDKKPMDDKEKKDSDCSSAKVAEKKDDEKECCNKPEATEDKPSEKKED